MGSANGRRRYIVTSSPIGWAHNQINPCISTTFNVSSYNDSIYIFICVTLIFIKGNWIIHFLLIYLFVYFVNATLTYPVWLQNDMYHVLLRYHWKNAFYHPFFTQHGFGHFNTVENTFYCDQAALWTPLSMCLSVTPFWLLLSSYHHEIFMSNYHWQK